MARSAQSAKALSDAGATSHPGLSENIDSIKSGAAAADGVIHLGFMHNFSNFKAAADAYQHAIEAIGDTLANTDKPLVSASGILNLATGGQLYPTNRLISENDQGQSSSFRQSDVATHAQSAKGVRTMVVRLALLVHDKTHCGLITLFIEAARRNKTAVYPQEGTNRWPAIHRLDAAKLFQLVPEEGMAGANYHDVADEGIQMRVKMYTIGYQLHVLVLSKTLEEAADYIGPTAF